MILNYTDLEWVVQSSEDLDTWSTAAVIRAAGLPATEMSGFTIEFDPGDPDQVLVKPSVVPEPERLFLRVGVVLR